MVIGTCAYLSVFGADYARGHGVIETEGIADRHYPLAYFEPVRITKRSYGKILSADLDEGNICFLVYANDPSREFAFRPIVSRLSFRRYPLHESLLGSGHPAR